MNNVRLIISGREYGGWKAVEITAGIERQVRDFTLSVTDKWPGQQDLPRRIRPGDRCEVYIDNDKLLTGYVDGTPIRYDARSISVGVKGRSKTCDLVDCSAVNSPGQWRGATIDRIAADLARPYGVDVIAEVAVGAALTHAIDQGETVFESIERMLKLRQLLATDDARGRLVFIAVGSGGRAGTALRVGHNVLGGAAELDFKDVYSEYICKGQRAGDDLDFGDAVAGVTASLKDDTIARRRVMLIKSSGQTDGGSAADRVKWEKAHRRGKAFATSYSVQGWRQEDGSLWRHNQLVRVIDPIIGFDNDLLISEVTYEKGEQGTLCHLKVCPPEAFVMNTATRTKGKSDSGQWTDVQPADSQVGRPVKTAGVKSGGWADAKAGK
ncbi:phage baseplate assembly protein [Noviherbaspirillum cavernae]|uniref:phage baseplate assembly protein n=1 Tax=Noviherbaspirillum cavernae TaxID=2320862 RepID=UPI0018F34E52|nr:baseplate protein [Noviherbaspirillum cavernae]